VVVHAAAEEADVLLAVLVLGQDLLDVPAERVLGGDGSGYVQLTSEAQMIRYLGEDVLDAGDAYRPQHLRLDFWNGVGDVGIHVGFGHHPDLHGLDCADETLVEMCTSTSVAGRKGYFSGT